MRLGQKIARLLAPGRVPVMHQMSAIDCGPACLAMIIGYYGRRMTVAEVSRIAGAGRDGTSGVRIVEAAQSMGLRAKAFSIKRLDDLKGLPLPAILHWEFKHFVVLERWTGTGGTIVDPAGGRRRVCREEFDRFFTGVAFEIEPGSDFAGRRQAPANRWLLFARALRGKRGVPALLGEVLLTSAVLQVVGLSIPLLTKVIVDRVVPLYRTDLMTPIALGLVLVVVVQALLRYLRGAALLSVQAKLDAKLMCDFCEHLLSLRYKFFQDRSAGDLLLRLNSNSTLRDILTGQTLSMILDGAFVFAYLGLLLTWAPTFGLFVLALAGLQALAMAASYRPVHTLTQQQLIAQAAAHSYLVEALVGVATVKASGAEQRVFASWSDLFMKQLNMSLQRGAVTLVVDAALAGLRSGASLFLLWFSARYVLNGTWTLGTALGLNALAAAALGPLSSLVSSSQQLQVVRAHLDRIADVLEAPPEQASSLVLDRPTLQGRIEVRNLTFRYQAGGPAILDGVSFVVPKGAKLAIVGRTGSGKSTLLKLLLGLYEPESGEIAYDGVPLRNVSLRHLRSQIGVVLQDTSLFTGSIYDNIAFTDPDAPMARIAAAARDAGLAEDIQRLPMQFSTRVTEAGGNLSGGQRQRLALARALVREPAILLLDEASSHLDQQTERVIERNLNDLTMTRIIVAHRLTTIVSADMILVLDAGRVVEAGTHADLMARGGTYASLHASLQDAGARGWSGDEAEHLVVQV